MRKLMLTVLLATGAAMPAMAQDRDFGGRQRDRGAQNESSEEPDQARAARHTDRAQRTERPEQVERAQRVEQERPQVAERAVEQQDVRQPEMQQQVIQERQSERQRGERGDWDQRRADSGRGFRDAQRQPSAAPYAESGQVLSQQPDFRGGRNGSILGQVIEQDRERQGQVAVHRDRDGRDRSRHSGTDRQWSNHWRDDHNYDWRHHRDRNRSIFRLGNYWDPYGSRYRRFSIGFSLFPSYYRSNYWLDDPWMYRLPPAYGPYRWVRYYDDALLVNIYTGQVVDVVRSFFW